MWKYNDFPCYSYPLTGKRESSQKPFGNSYLCINTWITLTSLLSPSEGSNRFVRQEFPFQKIYCVCVYAHIFWHVFVNHIPFFYLFQCLPDLHAWCLLVFTGNFLNNWWTFFAIFLSLGIKTFLNKRSNTTWFGYLLSLVSNLLHKQWDCRCFISLRNRDQEVSQKSLN